MNAFEDRNVINGSWGEAWCGSEYLAEVIGMSAKIEMDFETVNRVRKLGKGKKLMGYEGKGEIKLNKVSSKFLKLMSENLKAGKQTTISFTSKLEDPDALGAERVHIKDATLETMTLVDWEAKKLGEESIPFSFTDWDLLDIIDE